MMSASKAGEGSTAVAVLCAVRHHEAAAVFVMPWHNTFSSFVGIRMICSIRLIETWTILAGIFLDSNSISSPHAIFCKPRLPVILAFALTVAIYPEKLITALLIGFAHSADLEQRGQLCFAKDLGSKNRVSVTSCHNPFAVCAITIREGMFRIEPAGLRLGDQVLSSSAYSTDQEFFMTNPSFKILLGHLIIYEPSRLIPVFPCRRF